MGTLKESTEQTELAGEATAMEYFEKRTPSYLPYYITRHKRLARRRFLHARSKEHALKHINIRTGWLAIFWIIVFLVVMFILYMLLRDLLVTYFSNPIATQILTEHSNLPFPDVTICPVSPFSKRSLSQKEVDELDDLQKQVKQKLNYAGLHASDANVQAAMLIQLATQRRRTQLESYKHLVYCAYNGEHCSFANFTEVVHLRYLKCFTFSPRPNKRNLTGGSGLSIVYLAEQSGSSSEPYMLLNDLESHMFDAPNYDGINVFVHNPGTFPGYEISSMPTSFAVHFGQIARVEVTGLEFVSSSDGSKKCTRNPLPYRYKSFGGSTKCLEYNYTYEDCVANRKQSRILETCGCYSDLLLVPHIPEPDDDPQAVGKPHVLDLSKLKVDFCRDLRHRTSQQARINFECHERLIKLPTSGVLDAYVSPAKIWESRNDPDVRKKLRQEVCPVNCQKTLYQTRSIDLTEIHESFVINLPVLTKHMMDLNFSTVGPNTTLHSRWAQMIDDTSAQLDFAVGKNIAILDIRLSAPRVDTWQEEQTNSLFALMANFGGTLGLCAGISFLSAFFLLIFFGNAFYHMLMSGVFWFWWNVFQGEPSPAAVDDLRIIEMRSREREDRDDNTRPFRSTRHLRAVSKILQEKERSGFFDPWAEAQMQNSPTLASQVGVRAGENYPVIKYLGKQNQWTLSQFTSVHLKHQ
ncbi:unnamed protein product [Mesocestoides corti]|uniref:Amiloride-sensitive sodium channel n=2 Tax=Mesocestoides corti TaxID=53468 RepID=A0A158QVM3_MESCO|nr:unnamed protein product [Mesocestoides corti]